MSRIQQVAANITAAAAAIGLPGTVTPWLKFDYYEPPFNLSLLVSQDLAGANNLVIDYVLGDPSTAMEHQALVSQATTVITVKESGPPIPVPLGGNLGHGLAIGDYVYLHETPAGVIDGVYSVATVVDAVTYTLTSSVSETLAGFLGKVATGKVITSGSTGDHIIGTTQIPAAGVTVSTSIQVLSPIVAARVRCITFAGAAVARLTAVQGSTSS